MGHRAAHEREILHARQADIGNKFAAPAQIAVVLLARHAFADALADRVLHQNSRLRPAPGPATAV
jgi:predicted oxidoreductase